MLLTRRHATIALATSGIASSFSVRAASPTRVSFGSINATSDAGAYLADAFGYCREEGLEIAFQVIQNAPAIIAAVATSQLDVGGLSVTPGLFTAPQQGIDLRIVGDKQSFSRGFGSTKIVVGKTSLRPTEAETVQGLKGKTVAINSKGAITFYLVAKLLEKHGMSLRDINLVEQSYANISVGIITGNIDAGTLIEPFVTKAIEQAGAQLVDPDLLDLIPDGQMSVTPLVYSEKFRARKDVANAFMRAYVRGVRAYNDAFVKGIRKDEVIAIIAKRTDVDAKLIEKSYLPGLDPNQKLNLAGFEAVQAFYASQGLVRKPIKVADVVDDSFAKAAVQSLGEYK
ncbi:ABC transporter substrate-binding protein [Roseiarcaceae bacterium H3SJ34-1]|uniref:ABC transporter substrate-binding protein n=1 Tax=Terripilifer ovatus TaxID=3032367 RepID=UPI003AB94EEF|nr:ABC transporter substrate-binding protein [Roseiarcaceae bacterium H3SJ34-1]